MITVLTTGCFDLLHEGHVRYLAACHALGERLIVLVDGDERVCSMKGDGRPVQPLSTRLCVVNALKVVHHALPIHSDTDILYFVKRLEPDIRAVGEEYRGKTVIGRELVERAGGKVAYIQKFGDASTTRTIEGLRRLA